MSTKLNRLPRESIGGWLFRQLVDAGIDRIPDKLALNNLAGTEIIQWHCQSTRCGKVFWTVLIDYPPYCPYCHVGITQLEANVYQIPEYVDEKESA